MLEDVLAAEQDPAPTQKRVRLGRLVLSIREHPSALRQTCVITASVLGGLAISCFVLVAAGVPAANLVDELIVETFLNPDNLRAVLAQSAPLILVGVGGALAFRVNFWNLGLSGQIIWAGIAATYVSIHKIGPNETRLALMLFAGCVGGAFWAAIPIAMKLRLGINEIISTLLLNYVAQYVLLDLLYGAWLDPKDNFPHSPQYSAGERLPEIGWGLNAALPLALIVVALAWWLITRTRLGVYMRFVQSNPRMAFATGVPVRSVIVTAVIISAACAALAGCAVTMAEEGRLTQSMSSNYGVSGVLIAFMARNNPVAVVLVAVFVASLFVTSQSLQVFYQIPFAMAQLIQAIIVICVATSDFAIRHRLRWAP